MKVRIERLDNFLIYGIEKIPQVEVVEKVVEKSVEKNAIPNKISKSGSFRIYGVEKKSTPNKVFKTERFRINGEPRKVKTDVPNQIFNLDSFEIKGTGTGKREEVKVEEKVINRRVEKITGPNEILKLDSFQLDGKSKPKIVEEEHQKEEKDVVPIKRKGFVEKINKKIIKKRENSKDKSISKESYSDLSIGNIDSICLMGTLKNFDSIKAQRMKMKREKPKAKDSNEEEKIEEGYYWNDWNEVIEPVISSNLLIPNSYDKVEIPHQITEEINTVEKVYLNKNKNWNDVIKPIKTTKLNVKGEKKEDKQIEKEKEELDIENFAFIISDSGKKFRESLHIENGGFDLEGNKGMILKEGPAQTIKITKQQILLPSKIEQFDLLSSTKREKSVIKPDVELKSVKENKLFIKGIKSVNDTSENQISKTINWNDTNFPKRQNSIKYIHYNKKP